MKLYQLRALDAVARLGGIRAAARDLGVTQPALTKALRELEAEAGLGLLERAHSGAVLSHAGQRLLLRSRAIFREFAYAEMELSQMRGETSGKVSIAISPLFARIVFPDAYTAFRREFPQIKIRVIESFISTTLPAIADGSLDFAVMLLAGTEVAANLLQEHWMDVDHRIVGRSGHPLAPKAALADLFRCDWLLTNAVETMGQLSLLGSIALQAALPLPRNIQEVPSAAMIEMLVAGSDALAIAPVFAGVSASPSLCPIDCDEVPPLVKSFGLVRRADTRLSPAAEGMRDAIRQAMRKLNLSADRRWRDDRRA